MATVKEIQDQVKNTVKKSQDTVVATVKGWTDTVNKAVPEINLPFAEQIPNYVPQAKSAVNSAFDIAEQVVSRQRELVNNVLDAVDTRLSPAETTTAAASDTTSKTTSQTKSETKSATKSA